MHKKIDYLKTQLHVGVSALNGGGLYHTDTKGLYWCGHTHHRTPRELLVECQTTILDLIKNHPDILDIKTLTKITTETRDEYSCDKTERKSD